MRGILTLTAQCHSSTSSYGVPSGSDTLWKIGVPNDGRVNYTAGSQESGFFDLVKTFYQCKDYATSKKLLKQTVETELAYINGVPYPVETYEWVLSSWLFRKKLRRHYSTANVR